MTRFSAVCTLLLALALQPCLLNAEPEGARVVTLENQKVALVLSSAGLVGLRNKVSGVECLTGETPTDWFRVFVKPVGFGSDGEGGRPEAVGSRQGVVRSFVGDGKSLTARYEFADRGLAVTWSVTLGANELARFRIEVENDSPLEVCEVEFPILKGVRVGDDPADDTLVLPGVWGQVWDNPAGAVRQPQRALAMQWLDLFDATGGVYVGSHDRQFLDTEYSTPANEGKSVDLSVKKFVRVAPRGRWRSDEVVIAAHVGDWHWGADRYREWADTWRRPVARPAWVRECDGWRAVDSAPFSDFPRHFAKARALGFNYLQTWGEMCELETDCGTFPYPSPLLGSLDELKEALHTVREEGGQVTFYLNCQLWNPEHSERPNLGCVPKTMLPPGVPVPAPGWYEANCPRSYDGSYPKGPGFRLMCAAATRWQEHLRYWTDQYARVYGSSGIYFDQMGCCNYLCANLEHGHEGYGAWTKGHLATLRQVVDTHRQRDPRFTTAFEGCSDIIGQYVDFQLASGVFHQGELYRYTFPEDIFIDGYSNGGVRTDFGGEQRGFNRIFLLGARFDGIPDNDFGQKMMALRKATKQVLYRTRYRDTVGLTVSLPEGQAVGRHQPKGLQGAKPDLDFDARLFVLSDRNTRAALVNVLNVSAVAGARISVQTEVLGPVGAAYAFDFEGGLSPLEVTRDTGTVSFTAPTALQSTVLLANKCEPLLEVEAPSNGAPGERIPVRVQVLNLNATPKRGLLTIRAPKGWSAKPVEFGPLAPGERAEKTLFLTIPNAARPGSHTLEVVASADGSVGVRYLELPVVLPLTVKAEQVGEEVVASFWNRVARTVKASASLRAEAPLSTANGQRSIELPPGGRRTETFPLKGIDLLDGIGHVALRSSGDQARALTILPPLLNGGFELCAGNDVPTYWHTYYPPDTRASSHVDTAQAFEGKQSLRLDPVIAHARYVMTRFTRLKPDSEYRIRAAIRRSGHSPDVWLGLYGYPGETQLAALGQLQEGPLGEWQTFEKTFRTLPDPNQDRFYCVYCYNWSPEVTAWFDGVRIEPVK